MADLNTSSGSGWRAPLNGSLAGHALSTYRELWAKVCRRRMYGAAHVLRNNLHYSSTHPVQMALSCACGAREDPPRLPDASGELVYDQHGQAHTCQAADEPCVPAVPPGALKAACMDADHSIRLCGCEWVCSGPPAR